MTYDEFKNVVKNGVQKNFEFYKEVAPMLFFLIEDDTGEKIMTVTPIHMFMTDIRSKDALSSVIEQFCKTKKVFSYCLVSESWMAMAENKDDIKNIVPSEHPNKKEIVMMLFENKYCTEMLYYDIIRTEDEPILSELNESNAGSTSEGRFSNILLSLEELN